MLYNYVKNPNILGDRCTQKQSVSLITTVMNVYQWIFIRIERRIIYIIRLNGWRPTYPKIAVQQTLPIYNIEPFVNEWHV